MSKMVDVCKALAEHINGMGLGIPVRAQRFNMAFLRREELSSRTPILIVSPAGLAQAIETRGEWGTRFDVDLVLIQGVDTGDIDAEDDLIGLNEKIPLMLVNQLFADCYVQSIDEGGLRTVFEEAQYEQSQVFIAITTITLSD